MPLPVIQPSRVTVMIKPVGALCNLDCTYCYYLPTKAVFEGHEHRMSLGTLESIFAGILPRFDDDVTIAWQGGEPTLAGLDFFHKAIEFQNKHRRPGQRITHCLQTNGTLLDEAWCRFFREQQFLIGLSVDGPPRFHDHYRLTNRHKSSSQSVLEGLDLLRRHAVDYNILCVINDYNVHHPEEVMQYLLNLGARWLQFIPAIEWEKDPGNPSQNILAPYAPPPADYGQFLCRTFDLWFERYRKRVSIREIDAVLNRLVLGVTPYCILDGACHNQITIEHDGAVFGCDHFVERRWQYAQIGAPDWANPVHLDGSTPIGLTVHGTGYAPNAAFPGRDIDSAADVARCYAPETAETAEARSTPSPHHPITASPLDSAWFDRIDAPRLGAFAIRKQNLPEKCQKCEYKPFCYGGCPKHRPLGGDQPEPTILCEAYLAFFHHAMPRLNWLADLLRRGQEIPDPEPGESRRFGLAPATGAGQRRQPATSTSGTRSRLSGNASPGRNDPCPCGSGLKFKKCHGRK